MNPAPSALKSTQTWFFSALVEPERLNSEECATRLLDSPQLDAQDRLAVYQRSYLLRLQSCLAEQFPALCHALGQDLFADFVREYLRANPSTSHSLYNLGEAFPSWLEKHRPDGESVETERETWVDFMVDLANYESALFHLYDAPGHEGQPWPAPTEKDASLVLQPCLTLLASRFNVAGYYHRIRKGASPNLPPRRAAFVAIARKNYVTSTFPISAVHYHLLSALQRKGNLPAALAEVAREHGLGDAQVTRAWKEQVRQPWLEAGFFVTRQPCRSAPQ